MRLLSFQVKNYRSIIDSSIIKLSEFDNVSVLAGQNESGKSSVLKALYDFERNQFDGGSLPFSTGERPKQEVFCTYKTDDNFIENLISELKEEYNVEEKSDEELFDKKRLLAIKQFTISSIEDAGKTRRTIDEKTFNILCSSVLSNSIQPKSDNELGDADEEDDGEDDEEEKKYIVISEQDNEKIAEILWRITPKIVFFDDFCDLLPDKIYLSALKENKNKEAGFMAVKNLEKILNTNFVSKNAEDDPTRGTKQNKENNSLSINFQEDWGQRIHGENKVKIEYDFQKREGEGDSGSYINFYIKTKEDQPLPPKQRSKGLIWFLSLWLELKARDLENNGLILLLDEPDQHLHVKAQKDILSLINKLSQKDQIIYSTHSPYLIETDHLNRVKLVLNTEDHGTKVEDITTSKIDTEYKKDALQPIADAIGLNINEFSTSAKRNVILEGLSDFYYFLAMKKILNRKGDYNFIPGIGVRQINNLISISIGYGMEWISIIDDDQEEGGKDSKKKFDEIKDFIFDGDNERTKEKVYILSKIAGVENMFDFNDLRLVDDTIVKDATNNNVFSVGRKRKILFSKLFFEKVYSKKIKIGQISNKAKNNFNKAFDFIEKNYK